MLGKAFYSNSVSPALSWSVFYSKCLVINKAYESEIAYFWFVFEHFRYFLGFSSIINVRVRFFNSDYFFASRFLKFCVFFSIESYSFLDELNYSNDLFDLVSEPQFFCLLIKYISYGNTLDEGLLAIQSSLDSVNSSGWCDTEFTWVVYNLASNFYRKRGAISLPQSVPNLEWWTSFDLFQYCFHPYSLPFRVIAPRLAFDFGRKFLLGVSGFGSWQVQKTNNQQYPDSSVSNRFMFSFQSQFNYSDIPALESHVSNFRQVHLFNPIFREMHDLPFLLSSLRPGFQNLPLMHVYNVIDKLHYTAVYPLQTGLFAQFIFDKYLYTHARALISLPDRYFSFVEGQYFVNFGLFNRSSGFYSCVNHISDWVVGRKSSFAGKMFLNTGILRFDDRISLNKLDVSFSIRRRFISQTIVNFWRVFFHLQKWFESVNYFFFQNLRGLGVTDDFGSHDLVNIFLGPLDSVNFERITRRSLLEFSKFLYSSHFLVVLFVFEISEDQLQWSGSFTQSNSLVDVGYDSALTEFEPGYRDRGFYSIHNRRHFSSLGFESIEQFYDYELWLFVFFSELIKLCSEGGV